VEPSYGFEVVVDGDEARVLARGEVDAAAQEDFRTAILEASRSDVVVIDLAGVEFMDSAGISALVRGARDAQAAGASIEIRNARAMVRRLIEITGIDQLVAVTPAASGDA
jgi:anti-anti-sigma factor